MRWLMVMATSMVLLEGAIVADAQVTARQARPEEERLLGPNEIEPPMLLEVPLVGDGENKPHLVDLPPNTSRMVRDTAAYKCRGITVSGIVLRKTKPNRKGAMDLVVMPMLMTDNRRDSVDLQVSLVNGDRVIATAQEEVTVGVTAGQVMAVGVLAVVSPDRDASEEFVFSFKSEEAFRQELGGDRALLRLVVTPLED